MKNIFLFVVLSHLLMNFAWSAAKPVAEVIKLRGVATKLLPGALEASKIELNDKLLEDTSIVTGPKSFIKIKFFDNSEVSVGPESKIVISQMPTKDPGIISLLKGRIRAEIKKEESRENNQQENKFFVRTRTAALGIRGTDFQTIYNPDNRMTSLLTYKGSVALARVDETTHDKLEGEQVPAKENLKDNTVIERDTQTKTVDVKNIAAKPSSEQELLKSVLAKNETVIVAPGQNAFSSAALKKSSLPVKISPVQLNALYKNRDFEEKALVNLKSGLDAPAAKSELAQAPQEAPAEGLYNARTGDFAPKAGGFIDLNSGLYVAPGADAVLDKEKGIYRSTKLGDVDAETGDYFAPKGLVLDAKKGFVLEQNAESKPELLALREDLNNSIARDVVVGDVDAPVKMAININEKFIRDRFTLALGSGEEELILNEGNASLLNDKMKSEDTIKLSVLWEMASTNRFRTFFGIDYRKAEFSNLLARNYTQDSPALFSLNGGLKYALTKEIDLKTKLNLDQKHFAAQNGASTFILKRVVTTKLSLGADGEFFESDHFSLFAEAMFTKGFRKRFSDLVLTSSNGIQLKVVPQYHFSDRKKIGLGFFMNQEKLTISNQYANNEQERKDSGLQLQYSFEL